MNTQISRRHLASFIFGAIVLILSPRSLAQTETNTLPTVWVIAISSVATESGSAMARFLIARSETNSALTVRLATEGSARSGVDYHALADTVTIAPGLSRTFVTVAAIDDSLAEDKETVVLRLVPDDNYVIGNQTNAFVIIPANDAPTAPSLQISDGFAHLFLPSTNGFRFQVECSTDLKSWSSVWTNTVTNGVIQFVDPDAKSFPRRFYRVLPHTASE